METSHKGNINLNLCTKLTLSNQLWVDYVPIHTEHVYQCVITITPPAESHFNYMGLDTSVEQTLWDKVRERCPHFRGLESVILQGAASFQG